jgi:acetolactate synthase-1/3 small subunit
MLMKVSTRDGSRSQIKELTEIFRGRLVDVSPEHVMVEISGRESKIEAFIEQMRPFGILEMVRTGRIAMLRDAAFTVDGPTGDRPPVEAQESAENPESA